MNHPPPWTYEDGDIFDAEGNFIVGLDYATPELVRAVLALPRILIALEKTQELQPVHAKKYVIEALNAVQGIGS